jgi:hypothetical protein
MEELALVMWSGSWCSTCEGIKKWFMDLEEIGIRCYIRDVEVDTPSLLYPVTTLPTFYFMRGGDVVLVIEGAKNKFELEGFARQVFGLPEAAE